MTDARRGVALIISAPSGTGKSTLVRMLRSEFPQFAYSVSYTTRTPRKGEVDGRDYHFVTRERFLSLREDGFFAEHAEVHDNLYGTPLRAALDILDHGRDLLFDVDVQGATQLQRTLGRGAYVFLFPPSFCELKSRLINRGSENEQALARRMSNARDEIRRATSFGYWVMNDSLENAYASIRAIYLAEQCRAGTRPNMLDSVLSTWKD
jgi:guanylate kinase